MQQQGYGPQPYQSQQQTARQEQTVKFYKSWWLIQSNAGQLQRDIPAMARDGWQLQFIARLGSNLFLRRVIVTIWVR
jgi:hypothetical protein